VVEVEAEELVVASPSLLAAATAAMAFTIVSSASDADRRWTWMAGDE
jgi:hypothetical protein